MFLQNVLKTSEMMGHKSLSGKTKQHKPKLLGSGYLPGGGVFYVKGWGPKVRYVLRNPGKPNFWAGSWDFCLDAPGVLEKSEQKVCIQFLAPTLSENDHLKRATHQSERVQGATE